MFLIRVDGNAKIGAGHLMRCMTIAEELAVQEGRETICFVCADLESAALVRENGFRAHVLKTDYRDMESELPEFSRFVAGLRVSTAVVDDVILVDSYFATDRYLSTLCGLGTVVLMDDMGGRPWPVNCVVNYNAPADSVHYVRLYEGRDVSLLIGSDYVPIRQQFQNIEYRVAEQVREILITTGGGDSENIAGNILERIWDTGLEFHLVTGRYNPHLAELKKLAEHRRGIAVYHDIKDMAGLMRRCDIAVTAGGSTIYELSAVGVPTVCFSCAANQELLVNYVGAVGAGAAAGAWHKDCCGTLERIAALFRDLREDREKREAFSICARSMIDGLGARRLAAALMEIGRIR